jgi:hypothetical protein
LIYISSWIIPLAIFLPNLLFFVLPPRNMPANNQNNESLLLKAAEGLGRLGVLVVPVFSPIYFSSGWDISACIAMILFLLFYYAGWVRYFVGNRDYGLLFLPMLRIPVPLAISPILYFLCGAVVLHSPFLLVSSIILAIGHIPISIVTARQIHTR